MLPSLKNALGRLNSPSEAKAKLSLHLEKKKHSKYKIHFYKVFEVRMTSMNPAFYAP